MCAVTFLFSTFTVFAEESVSELITKNVQFFVDGNAVEAKPLQDNTLSTKYQFDSDQTVKIKSETAIKYIYVLFDKPPKQWQMKVSGGDIFGGRYGIMHELVTFDKAETELELSFLENTQICDILIYSAGELPSNVEQWDPPLYDADMLLLPTHADDEILFFGPIIAKYAKEKSLQVAYLTNHFGEWYRQHELLEALWTAGITAYPIIPKFNDYFSESLEHAKTLYDMDQMMEYQVELLRRFKPEVVIGHDIGGEYGHGVHMLNTDLLMKSLEISGDKTKFPSSAVEYGVWDTPKTYLHLYKENSITLDVDTPLPQYENKTAFEVTQEAFAHHKSQSSFKVSKGGVYDCRKFGLYRTTVGNDTGTDLFENVTFSTMPVSSIPVESEVSSGVTDGVSSNASSNTVVAATSSDVSSKPNSKIMDTLDAMRPLIFIVSGIAIMIISMIRMSHKKNMTIRSMEKHVKKVRKE